MKFYVVSMKCIVCTRWHQSSLCIVATIAMYLQISRWHCSSALFSPPSVGKDAFASHLIADAGAWLTLMKEASQFPWHGTGIIFSGATAIFPLAASGPFTAVLKLAATPRIRVPPTPRDGIAEGLSLSGWGNIGV